MDRVSRHPFRLLASAHSARNRTGTAKHPRDLALDIVVVLVANIDVGSQEVHRHHFWYEPELQLTVSRYQIAYELRRSLTNHELQLRPDSQHVVERRGRIRLCKVRLRR
jgi:hypothetical protein